MAFSGADVLASNPTVQWLIENSPIKLQIARVWPFLGVAGGSISYPRQNDGVGGAQIINDGSAANDNSDLAEAVEFTFNEFVTSYAVNFADQDRYQDPSDVDAVEYALALRRLLYKYFQQLDDNSGGGGLPDYIASDGIGRLSGGGGALTLDLLDQAYNLVTANDGIPTVIMASTRGLRTYQKLCRDAGYEPPKVPWSWYDPAQMQMVGGEVTAFNGTPWLINDMMASAGSEAIDDQRIYFMVLGDDGKAGPTRGVTGIVPEHLKQTMFVKRTTMGNPDFGGGNLGTGQVTWVSWPAAFAIGSQGAISMLYNFTPIT